MIPVTNKKQDLDLLILAAHASELAPLVKLGRRHHLVKGGVGYLAAGVGPVAATFGLTHFLEDFSPMQIVAVGTAGVINTKKFKIGDVVTVESAGSESGFIECYTPEIQSSLIPPPQSPPYFKGREFHPPSLALREGPGEGSPMAKVYSPQEITRSPKWQKQLLKSGFDIEHLESFAFAFVAKKFSIPISIFLGLTNVIDKNAHRDWVKNQALVVKKICAQISGVR